MRLVSFRIKNFKSIVDTGTCHLSEKDNILVLAGQNEAGKSAVLEALSFFSRGPSANFERLHRRQSTHPQIICKFSPDEQDINILIEGIGENKLLAKTLKEKCVILRRGDTEKDDFDAIHVVQSLQDALSPWLNKEPTSPPLVGNALEPKLLEQTISLEEFEDRVTKRVREFIFFESFEGLLPGVIQVAEIPKYPAVQDFQKVFNVDFERVAMLGTLAIHREEARLKREASDDLNTYWTQQLEEGGKYNFAVKILPGQSATSQIEFTIDRNDDDPLFLEQKSKGFRWFSAFNLRLRAVGVDEASINNLVLLIDEPGQGLHEKAQLDIKRVLEELAQKGAQIIYTTHHPSLIGIEGQEFARIRIVSNTRNKGTKVENVAQFASHAVQGSKDALSPLITAMGIHSVQAFVHHQNFNIIVEGISDHYYLSGFNKLLIMDERFFFLPACGVSNVPNLVSILLGWGHKYCAIFDNDPGAGKKAYNLLKSKFYENDDVLAKKYIYQLKGCIGIEDIFSRKDFLSFVLNVTEDANPTLANHELAKDKKELYGRLFLERVEDSAVRLDEETTRRIKEVFAWLYNKYDLQGNQILKE